MNLKARYIWLIFIIELLIAVGLLFSCIYAPKSMNTFLIILIGIDFILMTFTIQYASYKSFKNKEMKKSYTKQVFKSDLNLYEVLENNEFENRKRSYGNSYLKIIDDNAYKVTLITNPDLYFKNTDDDNSNSKLAKRLNKCKKFMGVEIFLDKNEELLSKIKDFTLQGERVYYTALLKNEDEYICFNYENPNDNHKSNYDYLFDLLNMKSE